MSSVSFSEENVAGNTEGPGQRFLQLPPPPPPPRILQGAGSGPNYLLPETGSLDAFRLHFPSRDAHAFASSKGLFCTQTGPSLISAGGPLLTAAGKQFQISRSTRSFEDKAIYSAARTATTGSQRSINFMSGVGH